MSKRVINLLRKIKTDFTFASDNSDFQGNIIVGADASGKDATFYGSTANEKATWDASENTFSITNSSGDAIVTIGGDATGEYAIDVTNASTASGQIRANAFVTYSASELKTDIEPIEDAMEKINSLRGVTYNWKNSDSDQTGWAAEEVGFIADEVRQVVPQVVQVDKAGNASGIDYSKLTALLTEALKQQNKEIATLKEVLSGILKTQEIVLPVVKDINKARFGDWLSDKSAPQTISEPKPEPPPKVELKKEEPKPKVELKKEEPKPKVVEAKKKVTKSKKIKKNVAQCDHKNLNNVELENIFDMIAKEYPNL